MKKLVILAHPKKTSFSHALANEVQRVSQTQGHSIEILDLYDTDLKQDFLAFGDDQPTEKDTITQAIQSKIAAADELIFVFPIWWGDMPAILKNFWDCNFTAGFAFQYTSNGKSEGLLKGKTAHVIATSGAPSFFYKVLLHIQLLWKMNRIEFCGIKQKSFTVFGDVGRSATDTKKYLSQIAEILK